MARSIWTGAICFGLVTVPVKLYSAVNRKTVRFHQLNGKSGVRIAQKRVDPSTGDEVAYEDIVKGFELTPDRYVVIEPGELETLAAQEDQDDRDRGLRRARRHRPDLLRPPVLPRAGDRRGQALPAARRGDARDRPRRPSRGWSSAPRRRSSRCARWTTTSSACRRCSSPTRSSTADSIDEIPATADVDVTERELDIAKQLVESLAGPFEPDKYHDTYRQEVLDLIERKAAGEEIAVQPAADEEEEPVPDLMAALKASLDAVRDKDADGNGGGQAEEGARQVEGQVSGSLRLAQEGLNQELAPARGRVRPPRSGRHSTVTRTPRLRRADCTGPGIARRRHGRGFRFLDRDGEPVEDKEVLERIHELVDPAGVGGRVDLPVPGRPHPGHRRGRSRTQAVPLPPALARAPRHGEVRGHGRLRRARCRGCASASRPSSPRATSSPTTACAPAPCACSTAASSASAARTTPCATRATGWRR